MADSGSSSSAPTDAEVNRSFEGFDEEGDGEEGGLGEVVGEGGRRRMFSKVKLNFMCSTLTPLRFPKFQELRCMLYGYGDDRNPYTETVDFLEDLVHEFITEMTNKSMEIGRHGRVQVIENPLAPEIAYFNLRLLRWRTSSSWSASSLACTPESGSCSP